MIKFINTNAGVWMMGMLMMSVSSIWAQQRMVSYSDAIQMALARNTALQQQQNQSKVSQSERLQSMATFLPSVNANGSAYRTDGRQWSDDQGMMLNTTIDRANYAIGAQITIFNGFRNYYNLQQSIWLDDAQKHKVERTRQEVILEASRQFLQILLDKELLQIAEVDVELNLRLCEQVKAFAGIGTKTSADLLSQQAQLKLSEINRLTLQNKLRADKALLSNILMLESDVTYDIVSPNWNPDSIIIATPYHADLLMPLAAAQHPDVQRFIAEEKGAKQTVHLAQSDRFPQIGVFYDYGSYYASNIFDANDQKISIDRQLMKDNFTHQYGFSIRIPIFNHLQTRTSIVKGKMVYENVKLNRVHFERQMAMDIQNAIDEFGYYKEKYLATRLLAEATSLAYEKQSELYRMGKTDIASLTLERQRHVNALSEKAQAELTLLFQHIIVEYQVGTLATSIAY